MPEPSTSFDELEREFRLRATYGMDQELIDALRQQHIGMDEPNVERAFAEGEPIQVAGFARGCSLARQRNRPAGWLSRAAWRRRLCVGRRSLACWWYAAAAPAFPPNKST